MLFGEGLDVGFLFISTRVSLTTGVQLLVVDQCPHRSRRDMWDNLQVLSSDVSRLPDAVAS